MVLQSEPVLAVQSPSLPCFMVLQSDLNLVADGAVENQNSHRNRATHGWSKRPRQAATVASVGEKVDTLNDHFGRA